MAANLRMTWKSAELDLQNCVFRLEWVRLLLLHRLLPVAGQSLDSLSLGRRDIQAHFDRGAECYRDCVFPGHRANGQDPTQSTQNCDCRSERLTSDLRG